jgi:chromosome segregation ATPase
MPRDHHAPAGSADIAAVDPGNAIRELADRLEAAVDRAAEFRVRMELSERTQSTLEEALTEERRRREEAERERDELRRRLETAPEPRESPEMAEDEQQGRGAVPDAGGPVSGTSRPWWRRMFGV